MAIAYNIINKKDNVYIVVFEEAIYELFYTSNKLTKVETKILIPDIEYLVNIDIDGQYRIVLKEEFEADTIHNFYSIRNLENSIINDVYSLVCLKQSNLNCDNCITEEGVKAIEHRTILDKLLVYHSQYNLKYSVAFTSTFYKYLENVHTNYTCSFQNKINKIIATECSNSFFRNSSSILETYLGIYWSAMYFTAKRLAGNNEEQLKFVDIKYKFNHISECFCDLNLKPLNELEVQYLEGITAANTAPSVDDFIVRVEAASTIVNDLWTYIFTSFEFINNFTDSEGDGVGNVIITSLPVKGVFTLAGGQLIQAGDIFTRPQLVAARYVVTIDNASANFDNFNFRVSDNNVNPLYSDMSTIRINTAAYQNQPISQAGDLVLDLGNRQDYVFTIANLTSDLTPPYLDPDGDSLDAIRINTLPASGTLLVAGIPATVGQIIPALTIQNGLFIFDAPDTANAQNNQFSISLRDSGSMLWFPV